MGDFRFRPFISGKKGGRIQNANAFLISLVEHGPQNYHDTMERFLRFGYADKTFRPRMVQCMLAGAITVRNNQIHFLRWWNGKQDRGYVPNKELAKNYRGIVQRMSEVV